MNDITPATPTQTTEQTHEWEGEGGNLPPHVADPTKPSEEPQPLDPHPLKTDPFTTP